MKPIEKAADPRQQFNEQRLADYRENQKKRKSVKKVVIVKKGFKTIFEKEIGKEWENGILQTGNAKRLEKN